MQQTLFVTVQGWQRRLDIELPADVPVSDLIPLLLEMCNHSPEAAVGVPQNAASWVLYIASLGQPLRETQTLSTGGVLDGDVLLLQTQNALNRNAPMMEKRGATKVIEASEQTGMIGVTWEKGWPF